MKEHTVDDGHQSDDRIGEDLARRLRALGREPLPAPTRDRHLLAIRTTEIGSDAPAPQRRIRRRLVPVTAGALALALFAGGTTVAAAQDADPDDALYGVKRASEQVWVSLPRGPERAAAVHLSLAERRFGEASRRPEHAERLVSEGIDRAERAAEDLPEEAIDALRRKLERGLPEQASPMAHANLHRRCTRMAERHGVDIDCGTPPEVAHPGRGHRDGHPGKGGAMRGEDGHPGRGWGPGGRPEGVEGPPPGVPGEGEPDDED